ncbi:hypothetical protein SEVIR_5G134150v4 [Setaria viridis]
MCERGQAEHVAPGGFWSSGGRGTSRRDAPILSGRRVPRVAGSPRRHAVAGWGRGKARAVACGTPGHIARRRRARTWTRSGGYTTTRAVGEKDALNGSHRAGRAQLGGCPYRAARRASSSGAVARAACFTAGDTETGRRAGVTTDRGGRCRLLQLLLLLQPFIPRDVYQGAGADTVAGDSPSGRESGRNHLSPLDHAWYSRYS